MPPELTIGSMIVAASAPTDWRSMVSNAQSSSAFQSVMAVARKRRSD